MTIRAMLRHAAKATLLALALLASHGNTQSVCANKEDDRSQNLGRRRDGQARGPTRQSHRLAQTRLSRLLLPHSRTPHLQAVSRLRARAASPPDTWTGSNSRSPSSSGTTLLTSQSCRPKPTGSRPARSSSMPPSSTPRRQGRLSHGGRESPAFYEKTGMPLTPDGICPSCTMSFVKKER